MSKSTHGFMQQKCWKVLEWPSQSPDLNPIENMWWDFFQVKAVVSRKPRNLAEFELLAKEEWAKIPTACCQALISSYASHLEQVLQFMGAATKY